MLWPDRLASLSAAVGALARPVRGGVVVALCLLIAACQVRPLYYTADGTASIIPELKSIAIDVDFKNSEINSKDYVAAQALLNELTFALRDGGDLLEERYALSILLTKRTQRVAVEEYEDLPNAFFVELIATFTLFDNTTRRTLLTGTSFANSSYDFSSQRFANIRAERDADQRAAGVVASDMKTRLAVYFARHPSPAPAQPATVQPAAAQPAL